MSDFLSMEEYRLIDDHLTDIEVIDCEVGAFFEDIVSPHGGGQMCRDARARVSRRQKRFTRFNKETLSPVPTARTRLMIELAKIMTAKEIGAELDLPRNTVASRLRAHGVKPVSQKVRDEEARDARRAPLIIMMANGCSDGEIANKTGLGLPTVRRDVAALIEQGNLRATPKSGPKLSKTSAARRDLVREMMSEGRSLKQMAERTGVSKTTIRWDVRMLERTGAIRVCAKPGRRPNQVSAVIGNDAARSEPR